MRHPHRRALSRAAAATLVLVGAARAGAMQQPGAASAAYAPGAGARVVAADDCWIVSVERPGLTETYWIDPGSRRVVAYQVPLDATGRALRVVTVGTI